MPYLLGKSDVQRKLLGRLDKEFHACARRYNLPWGDFPSVDRYRAMLSEVKDFLSEFKRLDKSIIHEMDKVMTVDIPRLLEAATAQAVSSRRPAPPSPSPSPRTSEEVTTPLNQAPYDGSVQQEHIGVAHGSAVSTGDNMKV